jgi:hypothetical protein
MRITSAHRLARALTARALTARALTVRAITARALTVCAPAALALMVCAVAAAPCAAQQVVDSAWAPPVRHPAFAPGTGPTVYIDEAHNNMHTATGAFLPFARLLAADGFKVGRFQSPFTKASLDTIAVLVISNAIAKDNDTNWTRPIHSAFTADEITAVHDWVEHGGKLLLIADHMPFAGAAMNLGGAFGLWYIDGFAIQRGEFDGSTMYRRSDGSLVSSAITNGRTRAERVDSVATFTGSAMTRDVLVDSLLILPKNSLVLMPQSAGEFSDSTARISGSHLLQAATRTVGRGRVAVFGEAGMFTAQRIGPERGPMGLNDPRASQNPLFILNVMHWLVGLL